MGIIDFFNTNKFPSIERELKNVFYNMFKNNSEIFENIQENKEVEIEQDGVKTSINYEVVRGMNGHRETKIIMTKDDVKITMYSINFDVLNGRNKGISLEVGDKEIFSTEAGYSQRMNGLESYWSSINMMNQDGKIPYKNIPHKSLKEIIEYGKSVSNDEYKKYYEFLEEMIFNRKFHRGGEKKKSQEVKASKSSEKKEENIDIILNAISEMEEKMKSMEKEIAQMKSSINPKDERRPSDSIKTEEDEIEVL